ncbi:hypothetical protein EsH8_I_001610 [Colletotrichum jinshuiense]
MSAPSTVLITGGNRGIGRGFVHAFLARPSTTVIAAVRDPTHLTSKALHDLPKAKNSQLIIFKLDSSHPDEATERVAQIQKEYNIGSLDIVIANAGIAIDGTTVRNTSIENINQHLLVNTIGPVALFQATAELLKLSKTGNPIFIGISSIIGSIGSMDAFAEYPPTQSPYGGSKAALNWFIRRLHYEEPWLTSFVFQPGLVDTELAASAVAAGPSTLKLADLGPLSVETSVSSMMKIITAASRAVSGTFQNYDGTVILW